MCKNTLHDLNISASQKDAANELLSRIDPATEDRASESDRVWFAARPGRRYRLRPRLPGEGGGACPELREMLVYQVHPGNRIRFPVGSTDGARRPSDTDAELTRLWELIVAGETATIEPDGRVVSLAEAGGGRHDA